MESTQFPVQSLKAAKEMKLAPSDFTVGSFMFGAWFNPKTEYDTEEAVETSIHPWKISQMIKKQQPDSENPDGCVTVTSRQYDWDTSEIHFEWSNTRSPYRFKSRVGEYALFSNYLDARAWLINRIATSLKR